MDTMDFVQQDQFIRDCIFNNLLLDDDFFNDVDDDDGFISGFVHVHQDIEEASFPERSSFYISSSTDHTTPLSPIATTLEHHSEIPMSTPVHKLPTKEYSEKFCTPRTLLAIQSIGSNNTVNIENLPPLTFKPNIWSYQKDTQDQVIHFINFKQQSDNCGNQQKIELASQLKTESFHQLPYSDLTQHLTHSKQTNKFTEKNNSYANNIINNGQTRRFSEASSTDSMLFSPTIMDLPTPTSFPVTPVTTAHHITTTPANNYFAPHYYQKHSNTDNSNNKSNGGIRPTHIQQLHRDSLLPPPPPPPLHSSSSCPSSIASSCLTFRNFLGTVFTVPYNSLFFVIKSYSILDVNASFQHLIWTSTELGNKRLDKAFYDLHSTSSTHPLCGKVFLFFLVNSSGKFCGVAEMKNRVDFNDTRDIWIEQSRWKGIFPIEWLLVKDVPNKYFQHLKVPANEFKPVTNSRDTQEIPFEVGISMLKIISSFRCP